MVDQYLQHLMALIGSNRIFASYEFMKNLPPNTPIPNKNNLFCELEAKVDKARVLTREVNRLLTKASYPKALENLQRAKQLVPDFPNIQNDIDFIEGTIANLQESLTSAEVAAKKGQQKKVREFLDTATKIDGRNIAISRIEKKLQKTIKKKKVRNILVTTMIILTPFAYCGFEQLSFMESNSQWGRANSYIARNEYRLAQAEMDNVKKSLHHVRILNQVGKERLLACVSNMTDSTRFQQGLLGKVLHEGQFIELTSKQELDQIARLCQKAEANSAEKKWHAALTDYQKALKVALNDENFHQATIEDLQKSIMEIRDIMYAQYEEQGRESFKAMISKADVLYQERRWAEAMDSYEEALKLARENRLSDYDLVNRISRARHESDINNSLEEAQALLALNKEVEAREIFERIIVLSEENGLIGLAATAVSREMLAKIDKNIFLAKINNLEEQARKLQAEKKHQEALAHYQEALAELQINSKKFQLDPSSREKTIKAAIAEIGKQQVVANQHSYLLSAYQNILRKTFNLSTNIDLKQPQVVFLKKDNNVLIYKVTALGSQPSNGSSPQTKYEVNYKFDMGTGSWALNDSPTS